MGGVVKSVGSALGFGGDDSGKDIKKAAKIQAKAETESLRYLQEREAIPQQFREGALTQLGGIYGLEGGEGDQQALIDRAIQSPLYGALMGGKELGEEAIMRHAGATGGLRSGNVQGAMYDYNTQLQNQALLESYNQQLQGLAGIAGIPSGAPAIAQQMSQIGQTQAQGRIAKTQFEQQQQQQGIGNLMGLGQLGIAAYGASMFSDRRLKKNIKLLGEIKGFNFYSFDWNTIAEKLGLFGNTCGCMAEEVYSKNPNAVILRNDFMFVKYDMIGVL